MDVCEIRPCCGFPVHALAHASLGWRAVGWDRCSACCGTSLRTFLLGRASTLRLLCSPVTSIPRVWGKRSWDKWCEIISQSLSFNTLISVSSDLPSLRCYCCHWMASEQNICRLGVDFYLLLANCVSSFTV